jgi:predicted lipoprotein with Yx(FWY)xxD motif
MSGRIKVFVLAAMQALLLAACGGDTDAGSSPEPSPTEQSESPEPSEEPAEEEYTIEAADSDLGQIVTDDEGRTLYVFMADTGAESTCYDDCEASWPPLTVDGEPTAEGIDVSLLGTSERTDGSVQVMLDGHPLYYFASDESPGDVNGQGVGDVWFVVSPEGAPIQG